MEERLTERELALIMLIKEKSDTFTGLKKRGVTYDFVKFSATLAKAERLGFLFYETGTFRKCTYGYFGTVEGSEAEKLIKGN